MEVEHKSEMQIYLENKTADHFGSLKIKSSALLHDSKTHYNNSLSVTITNEF